MEKIWVISLGGSRIVPDKVDEKLLKDFKKLIENHSDKKFVVVTGGGSTARNYINASKKFKKSIEQQSLVGISITRFHAEFLSRIFGEIANPPEKVPRNMRKIKNLLRKNQVVFCGALRWKANKTSDGTAAEIANCLKCKLINLTNVKGLYNSDPKKNKNAKRIPKITWEEFNKITQRIKFKPGQNFVLDQDASKIIMKNQIPTYILKDLKEIKKILKGEENFEGTLIKG